MGRYIAKLGEDAYVEWSSVVDAPTSWVHDRAAAVGAWGADRIGRADTNGTSILDGYPAGSTPEEIVRQNRAGPQGSTLTVEQVLARHASPEAYEAFDAEYKVVERNVIDMEEVWTERVVWREGDARVQERHAS
jgi:hypothetical protein